MSWFCLIGQYENGDIFSLNWNRSMFNMADFLKNYKYKYIYMSSINFISLTNIFVVNRNLKDVSFKIGFTLSIITIFVNSTICSKRDPH